MYIMKGPEPWIYPGEEYTVLSCSLGGGKRTFY